MMNMWSIQNVRQPGLGRRHGALADPLEGADWDGLRWSIPLLARLVAGPRGSTRNDKKIKQVERFTVPAGANSVCVS